jgi:multidrug efflux pump subunit AcrB
MPGCRKLWRAFAAIAAAIANVSTNYLDNGLSANIVVDRDTAARFGITAATIDNALYDAFGQRIISTIFTQSNQYRVILEAEPHAAGLGQIAAFDLSAVLGGGQVPLDAIAKSSSSRRRWSAIIWASSPPPCLLRRGARRYSLGAAVDAITEGGSGTSPCPPASPRPSRARRSHSRTRWATIAAHPGRDRHRLYRAGRAL